MSSLLLPREAILSLLLLLVVTTRAHAATPAAVFDDIKTRATPMNSNACSSPFPRAAICTIPAAAACRWTTSSSITPT
ncbi:MAG: hypothetical protein ACKVVO_19095, partial [Opitutaceae bacterium]